MWHSRQTLEQWYRDVVAGREVEVRGMILAYLQARAVLTGTNGMGLRFSASGPRRVLAYREGGCSAQLWIDGIGWCLPEDEQTEADNPVWAPLLEALGLSVA